MRQKSRPAKIASTPSRRLKKCLRTFAARPAGIFRRRRKSALCLRACAVGDIKIDEGKRYNVFGPSGPVLGAYAA